VKKIFTFAAVGVAAISFAAVHSASAEPIAGKGEVVGGALQQTLSSKTSHDGDTFALVEKNTLFHHNPALAGATIDGHVENVSPRSRTHKASMTIVFDDVKLADGTTMPIQAKLDSMKEFEAHTHHIRDAGLIVGGAMAGHMFAKRHHGGMAGAAAGFALATSMKSDITVRQGTLVKLVLQAPLDRANAGAASQQ